MRMIKEIATWILAIVIVASLILWGVDAVIAPLAIFKVIWSVLFG